MRPEIQMMRRSEGKKIPGEILVRLEWNRDRINLNISEL